MVCKFELAFFLAKSNGLPSKISRRSLRTISRKNIPTRQHRVMVRYMSKSAGIKLRGMSTLSINGGDVFRRIRPI
jgi:hypothetical protein